MILKDADIEEFMRLAREDGVSLSRAAAAETATRLVLLYRHLARPTPSELAEGLAKRRERGTVMENPATPLIPPQFPQ